MSKRGGDSTYRGNTKVKKRKGVKVRVAVVSDDNEERTPQNTGTDYARLVRTRVTTSGKAGNITTSSVPLLEVEDTAKGLPTEVDTNPVGDTAEDIPATIRTTRRKKKKANDSVSLPQFPSLSCVADTPSDKDAVLAHHAIRRA